ncbi:hypothetical protein V8F20_012410 [Naviculisporaceae sp. PSN 640]
MAQTWNKLPTELKIKALGYAVADVRKLENPKARAKYACVNRDFQEEFEREAFRTLTISSNQRDRTNIKRIMTGARRYYVQTIYYQVEIPMHSGDPSRVFSLAIIVLFKSLNRWSAEAPDILERRGGRGRELDIVVDSAPTERSMPTSDNVMRVTTTSPRKTASIRYPDASEPRAEPAPALEEPILVYHELGTLTRSRIMKLELISQLSITRRTTKCITPRGVAKIANCLPRLEQLR